MINIFKNINNRAFTLPELLISMAIFSLVVAAMVSSRLGQQNQTMTQQQAVDTQQNSRAVINVLSKEIRMAGYNPYSDLTTLGEGIIAAGNGILTTNGGTGPLTFSYVEAAYDNDNVDNDGDGTIDEANEGRDGFDNDLDGAVDERGELKTVSFFLSDLNGDGSANELTFNNAPLPLNTIYSNLVAENIIPCNIDGIDNDNDGSTDESDEALFVYLDSNNAITADLSSIRAVKINLKATNPSNELDFSYSEKYGHNNTRGLTVTIKCRNIGL